MSGEIRTDGHATCTETNVLTILNLIIKNEYLTKITLEEIIYVL